MTKRPIAVLGLRAKTARAIAVVLAGPHPSPAAIERAELSLMSPANPATFQPFHAVLELPWEEAEIAVRPVEAAIVALAAEAIAQVVHEVRSRGFGIERVAVVGAPERNLASIGNPHIRAHAAEGVLYRRVLELGAAAIGLATTLAVEKQLLARAPALLGLSTGEFTESLAGFGQVLGRPWRSDEKLAATGAWLALDR
jgi:hypothetical protein